MRGMGPALGACYGHRMRLIQHWSRYNHGHPCISYLLATNRCHRQVKESKVKCLFIQCFIMSKSPLRHSGMARVNKDHTVLPATHTFIHKRNEPYLPLLPSRRVSLHFGHYSFSVLLRTEGWVGPNG